MYVCMYVCMDMYVCMYVYVCMYMIYIIGIPKCIRADNALTLLCAHIYIYIYAHKHTHLNH